MYYSNHDRGHEPWENPIETTGRPVDEPPRKHKRKGSGAKVAALCLVCALVGGVVGGGGVAVASSASAAIGAISENDKVFGKALIFVALAEGIAIYGMLVSILIMLRL